MKSYPFSHVHQFFVGRAPMLAGIFFLAICSVGARSQELSPNVVIRWNQAALQGVRDSKFGPPMAARALAIVHTCITDAWAAYDARARNTQSGESLRQPRHERTKANKNKAISFAAYRAAVDLFPGDDTTVFRPLMEQLGYDPDDQSVDTRTPAVWETSPAMPSFNSGTTMDRISWETKVPVASPILTTLATLK